MRRLAVVALATTLFASAAFASETGAALAPGKPAGVSQASLAGNGLLLAFGLVIVGGGIALVATQGNSNTSIATTTTGTAP